MSSNTFPEPQPDSASYVRPRGMIWILKEQLEYNFKKPILHFLPGLKGAGLHLAFQFSYVRTDRLTESRSST